MIRVTAQWISIPRLYLFRVQRLIWNSLRLDSQKLYFDRLSAPMHPLKPCATFHSRVY